MPQAKLIGLFDINKDLASMIASTHKMVAYDSLDDLLDEEVDVIDICTPTSSHFELALKALQAGHHVLVEKPITLSSFQARKLIKEANHRGLKLGVIQHFVYSRGVSMIRKLLEGGAIGQPLHFEISYFLNTGERSHWASRPREGGRLWEDGIHPSYIIASFIGEPNRVDAAGTYHFHSKHSSVHITLEKGSITGAIHLSPILMQKFSFEVVGTGGCVYLDLMTDAVVKYREFRPGRHPWFRGGVEHSFNQLNRNIATTLDALKRGVRYAIFGCKEYNQYRLFQSFIDYINTGDKFYSTGNTGLHALLIVEKAAKALGISLP